MCLWGIFIIINWYRRAQPTVGSNTSYTKEPGKIAEESRVQTRKQLSSMVTTSIFAWVFALNFLNGMLWVWVRQTLCSPKLPLISVFYHSKQKKQTTGLDCTPESAEPVFFLETKGKQAFFPELPSISNPTCLHLLLLCGREWVKAKLQKTLREICSCHFTVNIPSFSLFVTVDV